MMNIGSKTFSLTCGLGALVAMMLVAQPQPAQAFGIGIPGIGGINFGGGGCYRCGRPRRPRTPRGETSENRDVGETRPGKPDKIMAGQGAPSSKEQTEVLRRIASSAVVTDVGSTKDLNEVGQQTLANDKNRDYTTKITEIIAEFKKAEKLGRDQARRESRGETREMTAGDVTAHGIEQSLDKAVKAAKLDIFERFVSEAWTSERIRVMILERVLTELPPLFEGNNRGLAPMEALDSLIQRAATTSYSRIFETSEFLAVNHVSSMFMERLYQTHGALVTDELKESTSGMLLRATAVALRPYETAMRRVSRDEGFMLRYRAQRIVYNCLVENIDKLTSSETKIKTIGEIEQRVQAAARNECGKWLEAQLGPANGELKPQRPLPVRVLWSADGPREQPGMYGRS